MDKSLRGRLKGLDEEQRAALQKMIDAGVNRLLHAPTTQIREEAARGGGEAVDEVLAMLTDLFALGDLVSLDETDSLLPGEAPSGGESLTSAPEHAAPQETAGPRAVVKTPAPAQMGIDDEPNADEKASDSSPVACARARFSGA